MKPCDTGKVGVATRQVTPNLSERQLRELLTALMKTPTDVVLQVGHILRLVLAVMVIGLPVGGRINGSESRGGLASGSKTSRRDIRATASSCAPAARRRSSLTTIEEKEQAMSTIATAMKQVKRAGSIGESGGSGAAKGSGEGEKVKQTKHLQSWAAKAKRTLPSLLELLESGVTAIGIEHARLIKAHAEAIPVEKAARALSAAGSTLGFMMSTADSVIQRHSSGVREPSSADGASGEETESEAPVLITETRVENQGATKEISVVKLQALARGVLKRAELWRAVAAVEVQARWRGALVRARLATEAKTWAETAAREESSAVTLQALARGVLKRTELHRADAAAVVQGAWRRRQARLQEERSSAVARAAEAVQAWYRRAAARAQGLRVGKEKGGKEKAKEEGEEEEEEEEGGGDKTEKAEMDGKKEEREKERSMAEHMQAARRELLQHAQLLPSALQSSWWTTNAGKQVYRRLEETYRQLANCMAGESGRFIDSCAVVDIAQTSPSSSLREEMAENEAAAGEMLTLEEVTAGPTNSAGNVTVTGGTPRPSGGPSPAIDHATTTAAGVPPSPPRRRRRSSTGSHGRSPPRPVSAAWPVPPGRQASTPRPTEACSSSPSKLSPPASPGGVGTAGGDDYHHHQYSEISPPPRAGDLGKASPSVVPSTADFAGGSSSDTPQQRERHEHHPPLVEPDESRTIDACLMEEPEWFSLCQSGYDSFTDAQVEWAMLMIAKVSDGIGAPTEILALAVMTLGAAFGDSTLLETSLRDDDLFLVPAACVLDALIRNGDVFECTLEMAIDTMISVTVAAKAGGGGGYGDANSSETVANDTKARLFKLRGMVKLATPDGCDWAGPMELIIELIRRSGIPTTKKKARGIRKKAEVFVRSAVLDGALGEFAPSQLACSAFFGATGILMAFDDDEAAGGADDDGESHQDSPGDDLVEEEPGRTKRTTSRNNGF